MIGRLMIGRCGTAVALAAAACLLAAVAGPALAGPALAGPALAAGQAGVSVSIHASSALSVSGDTIVQYQYSGRNKATISGQLAGGSAGDQATLQAQPFPYLSPFLPAGQPVKVTGAAQPYSFRVQPVIATRYRVQVTRPGSRRPVLLRSQVRTVYVSKQVTFGDSSQTCGRPVCKLAIRVFVTTPPLSYQTEAAKRWYAYLAVKLSPSRQPRPAGSLTLDGSAVIAPVRQVSDNEFEVTARLTVTIGHTDGYYWNVNMCQQDSYLIDGIGLPAAHGCGGPTIPSPPGYLG